MGRRMRSIKKFLAITLLALVVGLGAPATAPAQGTAESPGITVSGTAESPGIMGVAESPGFMVTVIIYLNAIV